MHVEPHYVLVQKASQALSGKGKPTQMEKTDLFLSKRVSRELLYQRYM